MKKQLRQIIGKKASRRVYKAAPSVGGAIALASVGGAIQRSGAIQRKRVGNADIVRGDFSRDNSSAE